MGFLHHLAKLILFTSVDEHERLPQTHAQQGVLHHQTGQAARRVSVRSRHVVDESPVPGGQQRVGASVPLSADAPRLRTFPVPSGGGIFFTSERGSEPVPRPTWLWAPAAAGGSMG